MVSFLSLAVSARNRACEPGASDFRFFAVFRGSEERTPSAATLLRVQMGECVCSAAHACNGHNCAVAQSARAWQDFYAEKAGCARNTRVYSHKRGAQISSWLRSILGMPAAMGNFRPVSVHTCGAPGCVRRQRQRQKRQCLYGGRIALLPNDP